MAGSHDHGHDSGHSDRFYWIVAAFLAVVTAIEVALFIVNEQGIIPKLFEVIILLLLSVGKGAGVVMFFMHLRGDRKPYQLVFLAPFVLASTFILLFLLLFSEHVGIAA